MSASLHFLRLEHYAKLKRVLTFLFKSSNFIGQDIKNSTKVVRPVSSDQLMCDTQS